MTDRDRSLQDEFDRHFRGDGPPPDTDDPEAAAYQIVFSALHEEPEGDLSDDFAEQVADRVGIGREPAFAWFDIVLLFLSVAALGTALVLFPSSFAPFETGFSMIAQSVRTLAGYVRLDVIATVGLTMATIAGLDALLSRWQPRRRVPVPSS